jgi:LacI family transcriptional regulator
MNATIKEVALKAGVSIATVSRVFNNSRLVNPKTNERVREIARSLHYVPNASARSLSRRKSDTFGMILPDLFGEFFSEVIRGADQTAQKHSYNVLLSSSHNNQEEIIEALNIMKGRVDGIIIMSPNINAKILHNNIHKTLPVILLNCFVEDNAFDSIVIDNFNGAYQIINHLMQHGHKLIAIIKGAIGNYEADIRLHGYRHALVHEHCEVSKSLEFEGNFSEESGYKCAIEILAMSPLPTAVFASNDAMAIGALKAFHDHRVVVPDEIALVGFDDIPITRYVKPSLSTVHVPIHKMGILAVERLIQVLGENNSTKKEKIIFPTQLTIRESCGCSV